MDMMAISLLYWDTVSFGVPCSVAGFDIDSSKTIRLMLESVSSPSSVKYDCILSLVRYLYSLCISKV